MTKIDFSNLAVYTDITKKNAVVRDVRERIANDLYAHGQGIAFHALALKIYNGTGEQEFDDKEYSLLLDYAHQMCTPVMIDAIKSLKETNSCPSTTVG